MRYDFKHVEELAWVALVAAGTAGLEILIRFDPATIEDWQTWAVAAAAGCLRAAAGAALGYLTRPRST